MYSKGGNSERIARSVIWDAKPLSTEGAPKCLHTEVAVTPMEARAPLSGLANYGPQASLSHGLFP